MVEEVCLNGIYKYILFIIYKFIYKYNNINILIIIFILYITLNKLRTINITSHYGWSQTDTKVELYIPVPDAKSIKPEQYTLLIQPQSLQFYVKNHQGTNYNFKISKLCNHINPNKTRTIFKTEKVVIHLAKMEIGKQWNDLKMKSVREVYNQLQRENSVNQELKCTDYDKRLLNDYGYQSIKESLNLQDIKKKLDPFYIPDINTTITAATSSSSTSNDRNQHQHH
ncbi:unnamed protein product [Cunninghamella echinulata]